MIVSADIRSCTRCRLDTVLDVCSRCRAAATRQPPPSTPRMAGPPVTALEDREAVMSGRQCPTCAGPRMYGGDGYAVCTAGHRWGIRAVV